ncbi:DUF3556 domain-containing protein [Streptomyces sp. NPDC056910]|uniref:DUF3556 domain-containing protein n=1 Tax=Streptomyces sp. NPDC056910 TaxID=3345964 RepID=UPI0036798AF0
MPSRSTPSAPASERRARGIRHVRTAPPGLRRLTQRRRHDVAYGREVSGRRAAGRPIHRQTQPYEVHDAALGLLERGHVKVHDMVTREPWPTDGPDCPVYEVQSPHPLRPVPDADGSVEGLSLTDTAS